MRAGPLSNPEIIGVLNRFFIPVYVVNEDYAKDGPAPQEEKADLASIFKQGYAKEMSVGTVHVYILSPNGNLLNTMHVAEAAKVPRLRGLLESVIAELALQPRPAFGNRADQSRKPACSTDEIALHLVARVLDGKGAWSDFPVENWIVLKKSEWREFLPSAPGQFEWNISEPLAQKLFGHFYPATENNDLRKNKFISQTLKARLDPGTQGKIMLEGEFEMNHPFYHKADDKVARSKVEGVVQMDPGSARPANLMLMTTDATYGGGRYAIAVRLVP